MNQSSATENLEEAQVTQGDSVASESTDVKHTSSVSQSALLSSGELLRQARLAANVSLESLSQSLKVSVKKLEALETNDWDQLPDHAFIRALASSVCRHLKVDSAQILAGLPKNKETQERHLFFKKASDPSFHVDKQEKISQSVRHLLSLPRIEIVLILLLATGLLIFLPDLFQQTNPSTPSKVSSQKLDAVDTPVATVSMANPIDTVLPNPAAPVSTPVPVAPSSVASSPVVVVPNNQIVPPLTTSTATPSDPTAAGVVAAVRLSVKGAVWVQIKDNKGITLIQRNLQPKEVINISGVPPLSLVIGRVNEIESLTVRGQPFNLASVAVDNVARFEVK